ncbi:type IV secretion system protein TraC [Pseudomonas sp. R5(2019)]|uniref:type IV secretion system protein TraC n=1 Tax=Pseudomonas sp. R5(2019) TaxID=2697566 RepID=UPI001413122E|nr:type IV secretion system protein TraC [Pseudomonas sp. R5(2019)]NBA95300.1 type IV secretion system protein TraC [Pseudomonas sp. R5(2019)]
MGAFISRFLNARDKFYKLCPVLAYDADNFMFQCEGNMISFGFVCQPLNGTNGKEASQLRATLSAGWPAGSIVQFDLVCHQNITADINRMLEMREDCPQRTLRDAIVKRGEFLQSKTLHPIDSNGVRVRDHVLLITAKIKISATFPTETEIIGASELRATLETTLINSGFQPKVLDSYSYINVMSSILNLGKDVSWRDGRKIDVDEDALIASQILDYDKDVTVFKDCIQIGDHYARTLSVKRYPRGVYQGEASYYLGDLMSGSVGIRCNCILSFTMLFPDQQSKKGELNRMRNWTIKQAQGPIINFVPRIREKKEGFDILFKKLDEGEPVIRGKFTCVVFAENRDQLVKNTSAAKSYFAIRQFGMLPDKYMALPIFLNALPMFTEESAAMELFRYRTFSASQAIALAPLYSDWKGTPTPQLCFTSRNGQLMTLDLFDSQTSYNAIVAAESGSGKSFLTNYLITAYRSTGAKVWVIDVGFSYQKICEEYRGDFVDFDPSKNLCCNPFELIQNYFGDDEDDDEGGDEDLIIGLLEAMAAPTEPLIDRQRAALKEHTANVYRVKGNNMIVDDIAEALIADEDTRVKDIGKQLYPFTTKGTYGKYFNGKNNVDFNNPFTILELSRLEGRKHLQQVVLLQLIYQIQKDMYMGDRSTRKILIIDEAWALLREGNIAKFIETGYRRFRKYNGSAITITQSINDLYEGSAGKAIADNSPYTFLLGQKSGALDTAKKEKRLDLNDTGYEFLKTVRSIRGVYSEIFILSNSGSGIARLFVDKFSLLLYSTNPDDVNAIAVKKSQGMETAAAIQAVMHDRGWDI